MLFTHKHIIDIIFARYNVQLLVYRILKFQNDHYWYIFENCSWNISTLIENKHFLLYTIASYQ